MAIKIDWQDLLKRFIGWQEVLKIFKNGWEVWPNTVPPTPTDDYLCFTANTANSSIRLDRYSNPTEVELETSIDKQTRSDYVFSWEYLWPTINLANVWDKVYFRNKSETPTGFNQWYGGFYVFKMTGSISWSWNINYLLCKYRYDALHWICYPQDIRWTWDTGRGRRFLCSCGP